MTKVIDSDNCLGTGEQFCPTVHNAHVPIRATSLGNVSEGYKDGYSVGRRREFVSEGRSNMQQQQHEVKLQTKNRMNVKGGPVNGSKGYSVNYDPEPEVVRRQASGQVIYKQEVAVRYLKPPTPPPPGPLIIKEVRATQAPPAPPVIIRQRPPRPATPPPMIIREKPPQTPQNCAPKVITRNLPPPPPPPRRVIIERLPPLPPKPRSIIVERWLPYKQQKRRVIYQRAPQIQHPEQQKNLIIQWEGAQVKILKEFRNLGIAKVDPNIYVQKFGPSLCHTSALPDFSKHMKLPNAHSAMGHDIDNISFSNGLSDHYEPNQNGIDLNYSGNYNAINDSYGTEITDYQNGHMLDSNTSFSMSDNNYSNVQVNDNQSHEPEIYEGGQLLNQQPFNYLHNSNQSDPQLIDGHCVELGVPPTTSSNFEDQRSDIPDYQPHIVNDQRHY
ncbi:hypothetical protein ACOME3_009709 [Neoechinorhynchus agilis]